MKFGVCGRIEESEAILQAGFDYVEVAAAGLDPGRCAGIPILATNVFFESGIRLFGPGRTPYRDYAERTIAAAASLDVRVMVVGSGAARRGGSLGEFVDVVGALSSIAHRYGIAIAPESLNRTETDVGNDLRELALALQGRGIGYTADSYHVLYDWNADGRRLDLETLWELQIPRKPTHVHVAGLARQGLDPLLEGFGDRLKALGYDGGVSLECSRDGSLDLGEALDAMRLLFLAESERRL